jgi:hypothetical protein
VPLAILPASALVLGTGVLLTSRLPLEGAIERLSAALLLSLAMLTAILLVAGVVLGSLDPVVVLLLAGLGFGVVAAATGIARPGAIANAAESWSRDSKRALDVISRHPSLAILAVLLVAVLAWRVILAVRLPVMDYDGLSYHLVSVDVWLQSGHIGRVPHRLWTDGYPSNGELLTLWLVLFSTSDTLARLTGVLAIPLAGLATAGLARELGAERRWGLLAGLLAISLPTVLVAADTTYVDNLVMAEIATAWFFGLRAVRTVGARGRRLALLFLTGVAIGLGIGTKLSLAIPLLVLGVAALLSVFLRVRAGGWRSALAELVALGLPTLVLGGYWYIKNLLVHGNPVWPFTLGPFPGRGTVEDLIVQTPRQLEGLSHWAQIAASWTADFGLSFYPFDVRLGGYGLMWPLLLVAAVAGMLVLLRRGRSQGLLAILVVCVPAVVALATAPMAWWARLTLFVPVVVIALAAVALTAAPRLSRVGGLALVVLAMASIGVAHQKANFTVSEGETRPGFNGLVRLVLADEAVRRERAYWRDCAEFARMPAGARVRTDGFNLLHLVAGPGLDRLLLVPFGSNVDPADAIHVDGVAATHMALINADHIAAAKADPTTFEWLGPVCRGVELFAVRRA